MILPKPAQLEKLIQEGPRKKDIIFWELGKKDSNRHNRNMWECWLLNQIRYLERRAKRSVKFKKSVSVNLEKAKRKKA